MRISVVTTLYYSESYIEEFTERIINSIQKITVDYELVIVNDGSPDKSLEKAVKLHKSNSNIKVIDLSRNFGHHKAMMTGLSQSDGDYVFLVDCDLEEPPELLNEFWEKINEDEYNDVVYGVQNKRKGGFVERLSGAIFYSLYNRLTSVSIPRNIVTARLMKRVYVDALMQYKEQEIFLAGIWYSAGFSQIPIEIKKGQNSPTTYNLSRKLSLLINSVTSFSNSPLKLVFYLGISTTFVSFLYVLFLIAQTLFFGVGVSGWPTVVASIWLVGGLTIFCLGIIGMYLSKIFIETKNRPYTIIKKTY